MVLTELADVLSGVDYVLKGLYYDLLLSEKSDDPQVRINLHQMVQKGYTNIYTKDRTNIDKSVSAGDVDFEDTVPCETVCAVCRARIKFDRKPQGTELSTCPYCGGRLQFSQKETEALDEPYKAVENGDDETEPTIYETECTCGNLIEFDQQTLDSGTVTCPACGEILIFTMEDEENEDPDQDDDDSVVYEVECACGTLIELDQQTLEAGEVICPTCGDVLEIYLE
jgi:uncharacterized Zn-finger protein